MSVDLVDRHPDRSGDAARIVEVGRAVPHVHDRRRVARIHYALQLGDRNAGEPQDLLVEGDGRKRFRGALSRWRDWLHLALEAAIQRIPGLFEIEIDL
jgi:hypothetical protein